MRRRRGWWSRGKKEKQVVPSLLLNIINWPFFWSDGIQYRRLLFSGMASSRCHFFSYLDPKLSFVFVTSCHPIFRRVTGGGGSRTMWISHIPMMKRPSLLLFTILNVYICYHFLDDDDEILNSKRPTTSRYMIVRKEGNHFDSVR